MSTEGQHGKRFAEWASQLRNDVEITWNLMQDDAVLQPGRQYLAGALNYLLTQLDLIPDHERAGLVDDAFVIRVAFGLTAEYAGKVDTKGSAHIARLSNEEDDIKAFLGDVTFAKLRRYVIDLGQKSVRGRTAEQIVVDAKARADMRRELDQAIKKLPVGNEITDSDAVGIETDVHSYFKMKLG